MNGIEKAILNVLENNCDMNLKVPYQRDVLSKLCGVALRKAVIAQVAEVLGGSLEVDNNGQGVIYTNTCFDDSANNDKPVHDWMG
jgi:hypothetical protein